METGDLEFSGSGFEGELAEDFIGLVFQRVGIKDTGEKTAYCFGPGGGEELITLGTRFKKVRACESNGNFLKQSRNIVNEHNLGNVSLLRGDAIKDLEKEYLLGNYYDVVTMLGFGPPFALDQHKVKQALLAANNILRDNNGRIIITSDSSTLEYLHKEAGKIWNKQGEASMVTAEVSNTKVSCIALSKIASRRIQASTFSPFSDLERVASKIKQDNKNILAQNIR